jgi:hypothetical protein
VNAATVSELINTGSVETDRRAEFTIKLRLNFFTDICTHPTDTPNIIFDSTDAALELDVKLAIDVISTVNGANPLPDNTTNREAFVFW